MRISSFVTPDQVEALAHAGGEYVELFLTKTVTNLLPDEFDELRRSAETWSIKPKAFSGMMPVDLKLTGVEVDVKAQDAYLRFMFDRVAQLCDTDAVVVFGSGGARSIPEAFIRERALDQLEHFLRRAANLARQRGITLALEPLNRRESNVFNSLAESGHFIRQRGLDDVVLLADLYHIMEANEPMSVIDEFGDLIRHVHIADSDRGAPGTGHYPLNEFFSHLHQIEYQGKCSIECNWIDFDREIGPTLEYCRNVLRDSR
jgi:sugar phosphate isomerase/epimerase